MAQKRNASDVLYYAPLINVIKMKCVIFVFVQYVIFNLFLLIVRCEKNIAALQIL